MKTVKTLLLMAAFVLPVFFAACSKDDDDDNGNGHSNGNHFTYDGNTYNLTGGFLFNHGQGYGEGYEFEVILVSEGIQLSADDWFTGEGHGIFFDLLSPDEDDLAPGIYEYDEEDSGAPFTFHIADLIIDYNIEEETGIYKEIVGGTVEVAKSGSTYTLTFEVVAEGNMPVTGSYKGTLHMLNPDDWDKSEPAGKSRRF